MFCDCAANFRKFYLLLWKNFVLQVRTRNGAPWSYRRAITDLVFVSDTETTWNSIWISNTTNGRSVGDNSQVRSHILSSSWCSGLPHKVLFLVLHHLSILTPSVINYIDLYELTHWKCILVWFVVGSLVWSEWGFNLVPHGLMHERDHYATPSPATPLINYAVTPIMLVTKVKKNLALILGALFLILGALFLIPKS